MLMDEELENSARAEIAAYRKEIARSYHQVNAEIGHLTKTIDRYSKQFSVKERAIAAQHTIRTEHLELAIIALEENLIDFVRGQGEPLTIVATQRR